MVLIIILGIILIVAVIIGSAVTKTPSQELHEKFVNLGTLTGKSLSSIVSVVGNANSVSSTIGADGEIIYIYQWIQPAYHIVLLFDENKICLGVSNETRIDE
jgi:hypothetical protein